MIFIFGAPRSGSTWLGKIFDSHPDLLYLHEPDIADRGTDLIPYWFENAPTPAEVENGRLYLQRLAARRDPRTMGIRPFFDKAYRRPVAEIARRGLIYAAKALERARLPGLANRLPIPDLSSGPLQLVIKSVGALGRAETLLAADPAMAPVLLIRHPCGYVRSMLQGKKMGIMPKAQRFGLLASTRAAARLGLGAEPPDEGDEVALLAWSWLLANAEAISAIEPAQGSVVRYEEVAHEPARHIRQLFERLGLGWPEQTETFLQQSQESQGDYYSVFRNSGDTAERWRKELDAGTIGKIRDIVARHPVGAQFF